MSACDLHLVVCALAREFVGLGEPSSGVELYREDVDGEASENPHAASVSGICNEMRGGEGVCPRVGGRTARHTSTRGGSPRQRMCAARLPLLHI